MLTIKALITTTVDNTLKYFFIFIVIFFSEKISLDISCQLSARQTIHMKYQVLFSLKNKINNFRMSSVTNCLLL